MKMFRLYTKRIKKDTRKAMIIRVDRLKSLQNLLPNEKEIARHLLALQQSKTEPSFEDTSHCLRLSLTNDTFETVLKEMQMKNDNQYQKEILCYIQPRNREIPILRILSEN